MSRVVSILVLACVVFGAGESSAGPVCRVGKFKGAEMAFITRPGKSGEFYSLVQAKETAEALRCCVSCVIPVGTKFIITDAGFASHTIRVLDGDSRGCEGDIAMEYTDCK